MDGDVDGDVDGNVMVMSCQSRGKPREMDVGIYRCISMYGCTYGCINVGMYACIYSYVCMFVLDTNSLWVGTSVDTNMNAETKIKNPGATGV